MQLCINRFLDVNKTWSLRWVKVLKVDMGARRIFFRGGQMVSRSSMGRGGVWFLERGCDPPPRQLGGLWESAVSSPIGVQGETPAQIDFVQFLTYWWPLAATIFAPDLLCTCTWQNLGTHWLPNLKQMPRPITSRQCKLTSEIEFFNAITLFNFSRGGQVPPCPSHESGPYVRHWHCVKPSNHLLREIILVFLAKRCYKILTSAVANDIDR